VVEDFIREAGERAQEMAGQWIRTVLAELGDRQLVGIGLVLGSGRPDFTLRQALSTHAATHNAEGWLFREALMRASRVCGLPVFGAVESGAYSAAANAAGLLPGRVTDHVEELRRAVGPPWGLDQKLAAAVGWLALAHGEGA
jgi:hypothetical protein